MFSSTEIILIQKALELLSKFLDLADGLPVLPNINFPTMGGEVF